LPCWWSENIQHIQNVCKNALGSRINICFTFGKQRGWWGKKKKKVVLCLCWRYISHFFVDTFDSWPHTNHIFLSTRVIY
jgi:hypothetical protein